MWSFATEFFHSACFQGIFILCAVCCAQLLQSCLTLCDFMNCSLPGSSVHGVLQASILEEAARPFSRGSFQPRDRTCVSYISCIGRQVLYHYGSLSQYIFYDWGYSNIWINQTWCFHSSVDRYLGFFLHLLYTVVTIEWRFPQFLPFLGGRGGEFRCEV